MTPQERRLQFLEQGYLIERGFFSMQEVAEVLAEIRAFEEPCKKRGAGERGGIIFTIESFRRSEVVRRFVSQQRLIDYLVPVAGPDLWVRWDQAVTKQPGAGVFHWHQDNAFTKLHTQHFQLWVALTESHNRNGGLWLAPGSHKRGSLPHAKLPGQRAVRSSVGESICVDASAGDMILFSSLLLHRTGPNEAETDRTAFVVEYLPLLDYDYSAVGPFFVVAEEGKGHPHFVQTQTGDSPANRRRYWKERAVRSVAQVVRNLRPKSK